MPPTLHHQTGLSFCVFVYVSRRLREGRAEKSSSLFFFPPTTGVLVNVLCTVIFTQLEPPSTGTCELVISRATVERRPGVI